jgi:hypothetical protein
VGNIKQHLYEPRSNSRGSFLCIAPVLCPTHPSLCSLLCMHKPPIIPRDRSCLSGGHGPLGPGQSLG